MNNKKIKGIRTWLTRRFGLLAVTPLVLLSVVLPAASYTIQRREAEQWQHEIAERALYVMSGAIEELENMLSLAVRLNDLMASDVDEQNRILSRLLSHKGKRHSSLIEELALLDGEGRTLALVSRIQVYTAADLGKRVEMEPLMLQPNRPKVHYSQVWLNARSAEPMIAMRVPIEDPRRGSLQGVIVAQIRLKEVLDLVTDIPVGKASRPYVVVGEGRVVAHADPSVVLRGTVIQQPCQDGIVRGLGGIMALRVCEKLNLGGGMLHVVIERPLHEALGFTLQLIYILVVLLALVLTGLISLRILVNRQLVKPIEALAETAQAITAGDLSRRVRPVVRDEIGLLGESFNHMAEQLVGTIDSLQKEIVRRGQLEGDLRRHRDNLAEMVDQATAQLIESNQQLQVEVEQRRLTEKALREQRDRAQNYLDMAGVILVILAPDQKVVLVNKKGVALLGYPENAIRGKNWFDHFVPEKERETARAAFASNLAGVRGPTETPFENAILASSGEEHLIAWRAAVLRDEAGQLIGILASGEDITERRRTEEELEKYQLHLEELVQARTAELQRTAVRLEEETIAREQARETAAVMEERSRLARELHDSVTQTMYSVVLMAEVGRELAASTTDQARLQSCLVKLGQDAEGALKELRLLIYDLRPKALGEEGLLGAVRQRLLAVERRSGVQGRFVVEGEGTLPPGVEEGLYRITQEALNNALKHSCAKNVLVRIAFADDRVDLEITDDGIGFDPLGPEAHASMGLPIMRERAEKLGGSFTLQSAPGQGTTVMAMIPAGN